MKLELLAAGGDVPFASALHPTRLRLGMWCPAVPVTTRIPEQKVQTSTGFPCQVLLAHLLLISEAHRRILDLSDATCS